MQVSVYKDPYSKAYLKSASMGVNPSSIDRNNQVKSSKTNFKDIQKDLETDTDEVPKNPNALISTSERNYFKKLFPENADQIEKHIVFNRNARVQTQSITKGLIFDGKI
jgi:hypothetical protein